MVVRPESATNGSAGRMKRLSRVCTTDSTNLPVRPAGKACQMWLVRVNRAPVSAGVLRASETIQGSLGDGSTASRN